MNHLKLTLYTLHSFIDGFMSPNKCVLGSDIL